MEALFHLNRVLLETAGLKDISVTELSIDGRLKMLRYRLIPGNHKPTSVGDFRGTVEGLQQVHSLGYVHGNVRIENIPGWKGSRECDMNTREIRENERASRKLSRAFLSVLPGSCHNMLRSRQSGDENTRGKKIRTLQV